MKNYGRKGMSPNGWLRGIITNSFLKTAVVAAFSIALGFVAGFNLKLDNLVNDGEVVNFSQAMAADSILAAKKSLRNSEDSANASELSEVSKLEDVIQMIKLLHIKNFTDDEAFGYALNGVLTSLDPHSAYLTKEEFKEMNSSISGKFGGLGIEVVAKDSFVSVVSAIEDTPADRAGIKSGDMIIEIDGDSIYGVSLIEAVKKMRGEPGTKIKLTIIRPNVSEPLHFNIKREEISYKHVRSDYYDGIAYFKVNSFSEIVVETLYKELEQLVKRYGAKNIQGVVLDLRNNPGGLLDESVKLAGAFLGDDKLVVSIKGKNPLANQEFKTIKTKDSILRGLPVAVLVNNGSASASEIVAGALQDHKRAIIIGEKTFGKGSVQRVIPLTNGSAIKITTALYYTPSGVSIQAEGISPDIEVPLAKVEIADSSNDLSISEAKLNKHLAQDDRATKSKKRIKDEEKNKTSKGSALMQKVYQQDYQFARAVDLLLGINIYKNSTSGFEILNKTAADIIPAKTE